MTLPQTLDQPDDKTHRLEQLVESTQRTVLEGVEGVIQRQMVPFLDHSRQTILATIDEAVHKHGETLGVRLKRVALDIGEELLKQQLPPLLERGRHLLWEGLDNAAVVQKYTDRLTAALKEVTRETVLEVFQVQLPSYSGRVGRRVIEYAFAGTLYCTAAVFLLVGLILGLREAGLPPYATYLLGGVVAGLAGAAVLKLHHPFGGRSAGKGPEAGHP
jgi:hypothetical protein